MSGYPKIRHNTGDFRRLLSHCLKNLLQKNLPNNAYDVPWTSITVRYLMRRLVIRVCIRFCGIGVHSVSNACLGFCSVLGCTDVAEIARCAYISCMLNQILGPVVEKASPY